MRMGFEIELVTDVERAPFVEALRAGLKLDVVQARIGDPKDYTRWYVVNDGSINTAGMSRDRYWLGHEIISPIMPMDKGLEVLESVFAWMAANNCHTNDSTGFHVGISFDTPEEITKLDPVKLSCLVDEKALLEDWGRQRNRYCKGTLADIRKKVIDGIKRDLIRGNIPKIPMNSLDMAPVARGLDKYHFINYGKMRLGYLEWRGMGGANYHLKFDKVRTSIQHYAEAMTIAADPTKTDRRVEGKVKTILRASKKKALDGIKDSIQNVEAQRAATTQRYEQQLAGLREIEVQLNGAPF